MTSAPPTPRAVTVRVPAKVNLELRVGPRRADGFHELSTVYMAVGLHDEVTAVPADDWQVEVTGPYAAASPRDETNLALRAARVLAAAGRRRRAGRRAHPQGDPRGGRHGRRVGRRRRGAARLRPPLWSRGCRATSCSRRPPASAATCRSSSPAASPSARAAASSSRRCWPAAATTGSSPSATPGCRPRRCTPSATGCAAPPRCPTPSPRPG